MGKLLLIILTVSFLLTASGALAQSSGTEYMLTAGMPVAGGGKSTSATYIMNGSVSLSAVGASSSGTYIASGGVIATLGQPTAFNVFYSVAPQTTVTAGLDHAFSITFSGGSSADTVGQLFYRLGGADTYTPVSMTRAEGDTTFTYTLPGSMMTSRGMEYYMILRVGSNSLSVGDPNGPYKFVCSFDNELGQRPNAIPASKYRIIGLPVALTGDSSVGAVFGDDMGGNYKKQWRLGNYDPATEAILEYPNAGTVRPGQGYWLINRSAKTYGAAGTSMLPDTTIGFVGYYRVALDSGWNQIANPFAFNIDWDLVLIDTGGVFVPHNEIDSVLSADSVYYYTDTGYITTQTLPAWEGGFVEAMRSGITLWYYYLESDGAVPKVNKTRPTISDEYWTVELKIENNGITDRGNFLGVRPDAANGYDRYDFSEPPPPPDGPRLAFRLPEEKSGLKRTDFRAPLDDGAEWLIDLSNCAGGILTINGWDQIPYDMDVWLKFGRSAIINLTEGEQIKIPGGFDKAVLVIGNEDYKSGKSPGLLAPLVFELEQNYPNPFNPSTNIGFSLPGSGYTRLEIFNILGQRVNSLINGDMHAGRYNVIWPGVDDGGSPVASGIYFYRLQHDESVARRKMLLLK